MEELEQPIEQTREVSYTLKMEAIGTIVNSMHAAYITTHSKPVTPSTLAEWHFIAHALLEVGTQPTNLSAYDTLIINVQAAKGNSKEPSDGN